jgi:hypothetical protein
MKRCRSRLRDRPGPPIRMVEVVMTPRQAEMFYDALWEVANERYLGLSATKRSYLAELRRRIIVAAELEVPA